jgi:hypothetical protein
VSRKPYRRGRVYAACPAEHRDQSGRPRNLILALIVNVAVTGIAVGALINGVGDKRVEFLVGVQESQTLA